MKPQMSGSCIKELEAIDWFANVGEPLEVDFGIPFTTVSNWKDMTLICKRLESENAFLEARNVLTMYLHNRYRDDYQHWNQITRVAKESLSTSVLGDILNYQRENNLETVIFERVRWQLLALLMEDAYKHFKPPQFFHRLLKVYQLGHFPGGWIGNWPEGELVIY